MASSLLLLLLCLLSGAGLLSAQGSEMTSQGPHFTGCRSREQETFRCWWSAGSFQNLSEPGALRVFFQMKKPFSNEWMECPDYTPTVQNECYFNKTFTHIWSLYCVQLRSLAQNITYDKYCFNVENIVHPDPPVGLNWTLLNVSRSGLNFDIMVRWAPPPSADVKMGWISLVYEVHYRRRNASHWDVLDLESGTKQSIYGLHTDKEYEVRVRCKMPTFNFGEFSDSIFVHVAQIPSKESTFPVTLVFIFGIVGVVILLMLIIFSQQQRLMVILLPPIPAPKIKGIDPELLKKGKLDELNSILSSQHMYKSDLYQDDPWVEFIELDVDEPGEKSEASDTQRLLGLGRPASSHTPGVKDDDSGRASCHDSDLPDPEALLTAVLLPGQAPRGQRPPVSRGNSSTPSLGAAAENRPLVQTQLSVQSWVNMDFYAQVSDVTPAGGVVLSSGQQSTVLEKSPEEEEEEEEERKMKFQLLVVSPDGAYTSESSARQISAEQPPAPEQGYQALPPQPCGEGRARQELFLPMTAPMGEYQTPYLLSDTALGALLPPVSDYTVVQDVDAQHSLLLNPSTPQPPPCQPNPTKHLPAMPAMPAIPMGYLTPDLLSNLTP